MGVYTFVCRKNGGEWTAKQHSGEIEASAATTYDLQRQLVAAASAADSSSGVQSSFSIVSPNSAVFQVWSSTAHPHKSP
jgi:large subunit ribosomal protein LP1